MAPAAPHGKPRCMVSSGVWCLEVYDIISGPDRWQGSGVSPAAGGENFWAFFSPQNILFPLKTYYVCVYTYTYMYVNSVRKICYLREDVLVMAGMKVMLRLLAY